MPVKKWYTIYEAANDELLTIGISQECADNLGLTINGFKSMLHKVKLGKNHKYIIAVEEVNNDYEETTGEVKIYGEKNVGVNRRRKYYFDEDEALSLYWMQYNDREIATELKIPISAIERWRKKRGLKALSSQGRPRKRRD